MSDWFRLEDVLHFQCWCSMLKILNLFRVIWDGKNARDITQAWFSYNFFQLNLRMIFLHLIYANPRCCSVLSWSCSNWEVDQLGGQCVLCISTSILVLCPQTLIKIIQKCCKMLQNAAKCSNILQNAATRCNTLQNAATCSNMLQLAAIHCNPV